jgi:hypothetical protein
LNQGFKEDEFAFLSEMIGPKGMAFDNDDVLDDSDDEDLKSDPISQMDMQVLIFLLPRFCHPDALCRSTSYRSSKNVRLETPTIFRMLFSR